MGLLTDTRDFVETNYIHERYIYIYIYIDLCGFVYMCLIETSLHQVFIFRAVFV